MPYRKIMFQPGVNREVTRYANEVGWYESDKVRFRQGLPEKIGGWSRISSAFFQGVCRSLSSWVTIAGGVYIGAGTHLKFYLELGGAYFDITPIRETTAAGDVTFSATNGSTTLAVADTAHGAVLNDFVTFSGAVTLGGTVTAAVLNQEYQITNVVDDDNYEVTLAAAANASDTGNGGASVVGAYQLNTGPDTVQAISGWGAGAWGGGAWGVGEGSTESLRYWTQTNYGEDLVYGPVNGGMYYWDADTGPSARGVNVTTLSGASDVPTIQRFLISSDVYRFVFALGANNIGETDADPMLVRWCAQEDITDWTPAATNQAGSIRLSKGSEIVTAIQARQEILIWTDSALYSMQYVGAPAVWGVQTVGSNVSIVSREARTFINGVCYWMGKDTFYMYDGRVQPLPCTLKRYVFNDVNRLQYEQFFASTVEAFNEVWFFYCSSESSTIDRYVIFNYVDNVWSYGTLNRTAWLDTGLTDYPIAATYSYNLVEHENGVDDNETATTASISASIKSGEFDIEDGDRISLINKCLPDVTFDGSTASNPSITMTFEPRANSGAPYNSPLSEGGNSSGTVTRTSTVDVEQYTEQVNLRVRGRQMSIEFASTDEGVKWQVGTPRIDLRPDGRR